MAWLLHYVLERVSMKNTYLICKNSVTVHVKGVTVTISKDDERYPEMMEIIKKNRLDDKTMSEALLVNAECLSLVEQLLGLE
jgi:uncharacterized protein (DUF111 family)